jgi:cleavage and polyadenylation specificity factor subunit 6/7
MPHPGVAPGYALPLAPAPGIAPIPLGISEREFDDIMARNRTVSSSAIARAVQDAASGEFGSAIETLVTAISLIKQSKVAGDDRCRILVTSLQDTLQGIENKSYSKSHRRERSRERSPRHPSFSRERERDYPPRERDHYQSSRERENYYRERSPRREEYRSGGGGGGGSGSRDKYYESDRYRREGESSSSRPKREEIMDRDRH